MSTVQEMETSRSKVYLCCLPMRVLRDLERRVVEILLSSMKRKSSCKLWLRLIPICGGSCKSAAYHKESHSKGVVFVQKDWQRQRIIIPREPVKKLRRHSIPSPVEVRMLDVSGGQL